MNFLVLDLMLREQPLQNFVMILIFVDMNCREEDVIKDI